MDTAQIMRVLRRGWYLVVVAVVLAVVGAIVVTERATPTYVTSARLFVATSGNNNPNALIPSDAFIQDRIASYVSVADSPLVAQRVIDQLKLTGITADTLAGEISATAPGTGAIVDINVTDSSASRARDVANAVGQELNDAVNELQDISSSKADAVKVTVLRPAGLPAKPTSPDPVRNIGFALVLGLLLGLGAALLRNALDLVLRTPADVAAASGGAPQLGSTPFVRSAKRDPLVINQGHESSEAFRQLRTNLRFVGPRSTSKVFVITSSVPGEGKSVITSNLALALGEAGSRVCVVDGDLRRPRQAAYLAVESVPGLSNVLSGQLDLDDALQTSGDTGVAVLASGPIPPNPSELLGSEVMEEVIGKLREAYDYVLIDTAPLLPVTDASVLAPLTDGALLVVAQGRTKRPQVQRSIDALSTVDARLVGVVTRAVSGRRGGTGYSRDYRYTPRTGAGSVPTMGEPGTTVGAVDGTAKTGRRARR